ncbi:MAG: hypothetical protein MK052_05225 [Alphaproteobacteria bacterium]|nr:hypothetical protein [Alphaproteobacteria bacterium]
MSNNADASELLKQIRSFIDTTHTHLEQGGEVDLAGLDEKVQELCEAVLDMPKAQADAYNQPLADLATDLTTLRDNMQVVKTDVREQLDALNTRQKAAKAYKTNESFKPKNNSE